MDFQASLTDNPNSTCFSTFSPISCDCKFHPPSWILGNLYGVHIWKLPFYNSVNPNISIYLVFIFTRGGGRWISSTKNQLLALSHNFQSTCTSFFFYHSRFSFHRIRPIFSGKTTQHGLRRIAQGAKPGEGGQLPGPKAGLESRFFLYISEGSGSKSSKKTQFFWGNVGRLVGCPPPKKFKKYRELHTSFCFCWLSFMDLFVVRIDGTCTYIFLVSAIRHWTHARSWAACANEYFPWSQEK